MARREDWPRRLEAAIQAASGRPFAWGSHDCCTFAAACVEAVTGRRLWPTEAPAYDSATGAARALRACGFESVEAAFDALLGPRVLVTMAQRGDILRLENEVGGMGCAVVDLSGQAAAGLGLHGIVRRPVLEAVAAWRVG